MKRGFYNFATGFLRYDFNNLVVIRRGGRNWRAKIVGAVLDHDLKFQHWRIKIINWKLWYKMFPSEKCTHWLDFNDPKYKVKA